MTKQDFDVRVKPWMAATMRIVLTAFVAAITTAWAVRGYFADATLKATTDLAETRRTLAVHETELSQIIHDEREHYSDLKIDISELRRVMLRSGYASKSTEP